MEQYNNISKAEQFLVDIYGSAEVRFIAIGIYPQKVYGHYAEKKQLLRRLNEENFEIYFIVNGGGYKDKEINKINAVFIDLDCGRDEFGNYFPLDFVRAYKEKKTAEINGFVFTPSYIVETRNGIHVYWLVNDRATVEQFSECQARLIEYFNSDEKCKNLARPMRLPGYYWCKDPINKYMTEVIQRYSVRYDINDIINCLPECNRSSATKTKGHFDTHNRNNKEVTVSIIGTQNIPILPGNLRFIIQQDIDVLQSIIKPETRLFSTHEQIYDCLKKQNLYLFTGLPKGKFNCLFHKDTTPSANIYLDPKTGYYWYKCFSQCDTAIDIIEVTERLLNCPRDVALRFLRKVYKIDYKENEWQQKWKRIIERNIELLQDEAKFKDVAPEAYKRIRHYVDQLIELNHFALEHVYTDKFTDTNGHLVFYAGTSFLAGKCKKGDVKQFNKVLSLFAYLGLIKKLSDDEIPEFLLKSAKHLAAKNKKAYRASYYSIPPYDESALAFSEMKAAEFKEKGFTMKAWGRELLLRTLGEAEADRVYPQRQGKGITEFNDTVARVMERIALESIDRKGWTTEKEIIAGLNLRFAGQQLYKEKHIKRILPELLDKYGLVRVRLNKAIKEAFGGESVGYRGYPFIIVKAACDIRANKKAS